MKKVLIFGSAVTELRSYVTRLPKGNEDFETQRSEQTISGAGFVCAYTFSHFGFPYTWITNIGGGVYGDFVKETGKKYNVEIPDKQMDTAGCLYRLMDNDGNSSFMLVPGSEYNFYEEDVENIDIDEYSAILVFGESLTGDGADDLADFVCRCEIPVYFMPGERADDMEEDLLDAMLERADILFANESEAYYLANEEFHDLADCAKKLHSLSQGKIVLLKQGEGLYIYDGEESYIAQENAHLDEVQCACALFASVFAKVDLKNACMYAISYSARLNGSLKKENQFAYERRKLAECILHQ